jgi:Domain of unknown function (DUF4114)
MADITLGQSIAGSLTSSDPRLDGRFFDDYDLRGIDGFRQIEIVVNRAPLSPSATIQLINTATNAVVAQNFSPISGSFSLDRTTFPGVNYKVRLLSAVVEDYSITIQDLGRAQSIVSNRFDVGTVGDSGIFSPLIAPVASSRITDVALASNGQIYAIGPDNVFGRTGILYRIDPSRASDISASEQRQGFNITDAQGINLNSSFNALEFDANNRLYAIDDNAVQARLYQIDVNTRVATLVSNLPTSFVSSGDLVFDAANNRFLATSRDTGSSDALWQIPLGNPAGASRIGQIGFLDIQGISFENGQLTGLSRGSAIRIDPATGLGTFNRSINAQTFFSGEITGASSILNITPVDPTPPVVPVTPVDPTPPVVPVTPVDPTPPVVPVTPVDPTPPVVPVTPVDPAPPVVPVTPVDPTPPVVPVTPVDPTPPVVPVTPVDPTPPVVPVTPVSPTPPVVPVTSAIAPIAANPGLLQLSQSNGINASLLFRKAGHQAANRNELGIFTVDDNNGVINGIAPGQSGYFTEVAKRSQVVFSSLSESPIDTALDRSLTRNVNLAANSKVGFYLAVNDSIDSPTAPANVLFSVPASSNSFQNARITPNATGVRVAFEDGSDQDFNDLVFTISNATNPPPLGITQQGSKEIFDLTGITVGARANFEIQRDAGFNNHVGFYKVEDALGTIRVGDALIRPGENGYRQAAVQGRITGADLTGVNNQITVGSADFAGGAIYAPFLIADSSVGNADFSNVYTAYSLGNTDQVDHIRLLGDNTFGFEDLNGGGDRDFNDLIVKATFT